MLRPEGDPWFKKFFRKGVNKDIDPLQLPDDQARDAQNMRPLDTNGFTGAMTKIGGEVTLFAPNEPGAQTYVCVGACNVNGRVMSFWCSSTQDPIVQLYDTVTSTGIIVAKSPNIPYTYNHLMQMPMTVQEGCNSGVVFPVDGNAVPLYWDVDTLLTNYNNNTGQFFAGYITDINSVGLLAPPSWPVLSKTTPLIDLGGPVGMFTGQHSYSLRFVYPPGDRTNWGMETPLIDVPGTYTQETIVNTVLGMGSNYPGGRTFGGLTSTTVPSQCGIHLRFRVDNLFGAESVEIKRRSYSNGQGLFGPGVETIVARITVTPDQNNIVDYVDPSESNVTEPVPPDSPDQQVVTLLNPEASEFADGRLTYANSDIAAQPIGVTFTSMSGGRAMTSITRALNKDMSGTIIPDGYSNPYNWTYYKSAQRGEKYGYGVQFYDAAQGKFFVIPIPGAENYQHPNQRDIKGANGAWVGATDPNGWGVESDLYSDNPIYAATNDLNTPPLSAEGNVGKTFGIMTQGSGRKTDLERVVNVAQRITGSPVVGRYAPAFMQYGNTVPDQVIPYTQGGVTWYVPSNSGYQPWDPRNNQAGFSGYNVPPVTSRMIAQAGTGGHIPADDLNPTGFQDQCFQFDPQNSRGQIMAPTYHALGCLLGGIENIPLYVSAMTIVRTKPAGRVVAQGFGSYVLSNGTTAPSAKDTAGVNVYFPDIAASINDQATIDDIMQNPGSYKVQFVSGLGFYHETYGYSGSADDLNWPGPTITANLMDSVFHARVMQDGNYPGGWVNVGEPGIGAMGYQPLPGNAPPGNYVGQDKWRSNLTMDGNTPVDPNSQTYSFWQQAQTGNAIFDLSSMQLFTTGRTSYYRIHTSQYIYAPDTNDVIAGPGDIRTDFDDPFVRAFHQPWLVVNIIKDGANVPIQNSTPYVNTGTNIAMRTCIGLYIQPSSDPVQDFELITDQEYYDSVGYLPTDYRYAYVQHPSTAERRYLCVTNNTQIDIAVILADIASLGFWIAPDGLPVYGLYDSVTLGEVQYLRFGNYPTLPPVGSRIVVKYPEGTPIRVFGHDIAIGPVTHSVVDAYATRDDIDNFTAQGILATAGLPMPYAGFGMNPRYFMPEKEAQTEEQIHCNYMGSYRQFCILWDAESRAQPPMYVNSNSTPTLLEDTQQMFPFIHYINRTYSEVSTVGPPNNFFPQYATDFPLEWTIFHYGGLRFLPGVNLDYAKQPDVDFEGLPRSGFEDITDMCSTMFASTKFLATQQDNPGLRTFFMENSHTISPENGPIWRIGSSTSGQGQNMYGWTERGVYRVLTDKNILSTATGDDLVSQSLDGYWGSEEWLTRTTGMPEVFKHLWTRWENMFWWADKRGIYQLGDGMGSISVNKYDSKILPLLGAVTPGYDRRMCSAYDPIHREVWFAIPDMRAFPNVIATRMVVYNLAMKEWIGEFTYEGDQFLAVGQDMLGFRNLITRTMNTGYTLNGEPLEAWVESAFCPYAGMETEAVWFRDNPTKPSRIEIRDQNGVFMFETDANLWGPTWVLKIDGYENAVGITTPGYATPRRRVTSTTLFKRTIHNEPVPFVEQISSLQLKQVV